MTTLWLRFVVESFDLLTACDTLFNEAAFWQEGLDKKLKSKLAATYIK